MERLKSSKIFSKCEIEGCEIDDCSSTYTKSLGTASNKKLGSVEGISCLQK